MSSSSGRRSTDRPTLPPIRDLFGNELNRLRITDDDNVSAYYQVNEEEFDLRTHYIRQPQHLNDYPQRPYQSTTRSSHPSSGVSSAESYTPFSSHHTSDEREQHRSSLHLTHSEYDPRNVSAPDHRYSTRAPPVPAPDYRYPTIGPPSNHSSTSPIPTRDFLHSTGRRTYPADLDYPTHSRVPIAPENWGKLEEAGHSSLRVPPRSGDLPSTVALPAKYECSHCGKGFNRPSSLKIHLNSHTGEKPFICPIEGCGRSFSVLSNMRRHARVHNQTAHASDEDTVSLSRPGPSRTTVASVDWHHYRRGSTASDVSSSESRHSRSGSSDSEDESYINARSVGKRVRQHHS
ncbi:hypothetical protein J3R30DRAFT_1743411 [Lentinula aciculospora]|uniref:C2H2-type domain-containing protein n=1 Tax=Lentinula aciculospora TaxID=153920 RepID=A0A9W9AJM0_9AGAR|nr:hypothetical protein J3R30DRAFT_1743411 [Lentinula aciculospora]